ncbi:MAG TPA: hypothetical protein PLJ62_09565 [Thermoflexales bacterium]|nr:hypothetical protein [Thermoflexales bacterium]HRA00433.1 hypothetical protein [Thermoflexales bacterium]
MDYQNLFSDFVMKHFSFLTEEYGFECVTNEWCQDSASCIINFDKDLLQVHLVWGLKDTQLYFSVNRYDPSVAQSSEYSPHAINPFDIPILGKKRDPKLDFSWLVNINEFTPAILEEKIKANADILQRYGAKILLNLTWFNQDTGEENLISDNEVLSE